MTAVTPARSQAHSHADADHSRSSRSRTGRRALAGLVLAGTLGVGLLGTAAPAGAAPKAPSAPAEAVAPGTTARKGAHGCARGVTAMHRLREHNDELRTRVTRLAERRRRALDKGDSAAVARIDATLAKAHTVHQRLIDRARTVASKLAERCSPTDQVAIDGSWELPA